MAGVRTRSLAVATLAALLVAAPARAATPSNQGTYSQYQAALASEKQIAARLAGADAAVVRAQADLAAVAAQQAATRHQLAGLKDQVSALDAGLASQQARTDAIIRFLYESGGFSFLGVVLQATSFSDFLTRFSMVSRIVAADVRELRRVAAEQAELRSRQAAVTATERKLAAESQAAKAVLARLQREQSARAQALAQAKQQAKAFGAKLQAMDQALLAGLPELNTVLAEWPKLPWAQVKPGAVNISGLELDVTVSAAALNSTLGIAPLTLVLGKDGVTLTSPPPASLQLQGPVAISGGDVIWKPDTLDVGGAPASPGVLTTLLAGRNLAIPLPAPAPGLRIHRIRLADGSLLLGFGF